MEVRGRGSMWGSTVRCVLSGVGALVIVPDGLYLNLWFLRVPLALVRRCSCGVSCSFDRGLAQVGRYAGACCMTVVSCPDRVQAA